MVDRTSVMNQGPVYPPPPAPPGSERPPRRRRWIWLVAAAVALVLVAGTAAAVFTVLRGDDPDPAVLDGPDQPRVVVPEAKIGVFRGTDPGEVAAFQSWMGTELDYVVDFSGRNTWDEIANPHYMIDAWKNTPYRPVYSVAMLPTEDQGATIEQGANKAYNDYYVQLARHLVEAGQQDAILRVGWEFNLEGSRWASDNPAQWIEYFRQIVISMRSVEGQQFEFDWNPNNGKNPYDAYQYYPGNDVVDYIGVDAYDTSWAFRAYPYPENCDDACRLERQQRAWDRSIYGGARGLKFWSAFARKQGKPMSLPEWGLWSRPDNHGGGANTFYLEKMAEFIADKNNDVAYQAYFEHDGDDGQHRLMTSFQPEGEKFKELFAR